MEKAEEAQGSKALDCGELTLCSLLNKACGNMQVCDVVHLQRLVVSTDAGAWGGDHARRRSVELQVGPSLLCSRAHYVFMIQSTGQQGRPQGGAAMQD